MSEQPRALYPDRAAIVLRDGRGPTSVTALRSALQSVRQRGYALEEGLVTPGLGSVAVVGLDHNEYPVAAVAVTYPEADVDAAARTELVAAVRRTASTISARVGHTR